MHLVQPASFQRPRSAPFPAPLCEACNAPMGLNGEYSPTVYGKMSPRREYQCRMCGTGKIVRRTVREVRCA
jgi:hypothetical protein